MPQQRGHVGERQPARRRALDQREERAELGLGQHQILEARAQHIADARDREAGLAAQGVGLARHAVTTGPELSSWSV